MPIYEYRCQSCRKRTTVFLRSFSSPLNAVCQHCGSTDLSRLVSNVAFIRSEESRLENLSESDLMAGVDENDPRSVARWARKLGQEMGEDLGPEFDEMVDRMEAGEMPDDLMGGEGGGMGGGEFDDLEEPAGAATGDDERSG